MQGYLDGWEDPVLLLRRRVEHGEPKKGGGRIGTAKRYQIFEKRRLSGQRAAQSEFPPIDIDIRRR